MGERTPRIMIIAGEASGDLNGARLAARIQEKLGNVEIYGVGGARMRQAGVRLLYDSSPWSAIGISEALKIAPRLFFYATRLRAELQARPPDVLIMIDFGAFNLFIGKSIPESTRVLYYFPPGSWKRGANYSRLKGLAERVITPFPWSAEGLQEQGIKGDFFGHPLMDIAKPTMAAEEFLSKFDFDTEIPIVGLLPGSRAQELENNLPALLIAAGRLLEKNGRLQFAIPLALSFDETAVAEELRKVPWLDVRAFGLHSGGTRNGTIALASSIRALARQDGFTPPERPISIKLLPGLAYDVLAHSRAAAVTSGTATVEAAILGCPMVIFYRGNKVTAVEYRLLARKIKFIGMPNIILDRKICPELIHLQATPNGICDELLKLIEDTPEREEMLKGLAEVRNILYVPGSVDKSAEVVLELLGVQNDRSRL